MNKIYSTVNNTNDKIKAMNYILKIGFYNYGSINKENKAYINLNNGSLLVIKFNMSLFTLQRFIKDLEIILNQGLNNTILKRYNLL